MKAILLYGLTATGKSTFCKYVNEKYNIKFVQVRRLFESIVGTDNAAAVYHELIKKTNSRCAWLEIISEDLKSFFNSQQIVIIEGLFTLEESAWFRNISDVIIVYLKKNKEQERAMRFSEREHLQIDSGIIKMKNSDIGRFDAGVLAVKSSADYIINNDSSLEEFFFAIDCFFVSIQ